MFGVTLTPSAANGYRIYKSLWGATTGGVSIKSASPGNVYGWYLSNNAVTPRFVKLYDLSSAPVSGTSVPTLTIEIPACPTSQSTTGAIAVYNCAHGITFYSGIGINVTGLVADNDNTAPVANDVVINLFYN